MEYPKFKVCCRCFTFNHSKYITDAMNGFTMQQTLFPFVCCIVDDASTDGEQEVIRKYVKENFDFSKGSVAYHKETDYAHITYAQHKTNKNCYFVVLYLKENHYSQKKPKYPYLRDWQILCEYEAICEGDDYWIHPKKLQMQVEFMASHPDYGMVHTDFNLTEGRRNHKIQIQPDGIYFPYLLYSNGLSIGTLTVLYRLSVYNTLPKLYKGKGWPMGDKPLWIEFAYKSKIGYINVVTAKYRVLKESASHSLDINRLITFHNAVVEINNYYANAFNIPIPKDKYNEDYYQNIVRAACRINDKNTAYHYYKEAKEQGKLTWKTSLFYFESKFPLLKKILDIYIKA